MKQILYNGIVVRVGLTEGEAQRIVRKLKKTFTGLIEIL